MLELLPQTIGEFFSDVVARRPDAPALGVIEEGRLQWRTWIELSRLVERRAAQLADKGIGAESRVAQVGPNSASWIVNDLALLRLRAVHVPIHASLSNLQSLELIQHSGAKWAIADAADASMHAAATDVRLLTNCELEQSTGANPTASPPNDSAGNAGASQDPDSLATILYTSGSTGTPRGVMLTHRNLFENARATVAAVSREAKETRLCFLPLSHVYARTCDLYCWIVRGTRLVLVESRDTIMRDCQIAKPTAISAVPYFYQRLADRLRNQPDGKRPGALKELLGGQVRHCYSGGAAAAPDVEALFERQGLPILSGYGLTETSPVVTATALERYEAGTVGRPLEILQVELAADGEVLVRGPSVMAGYLSDPQATSEVIRDGWLHTGDLGAWTEAGNLRIVGRKKEMIVLATGRNAAPAQLETRLSGSPLIEQVCVVGEDRPYLAALIVPNAEALRREIRDRRLLVWSRRRGLTHPKILALYRDEINQRLAGLATFEQIGGFVLLDRGFSLESGELTPKLSLRRGVIQERFSAEIEQIYRRSAQAGRIESA